VSRLALLAALVLVSSGCTCRKESPDPTPGAPPGGSSVAPTVAASTKADVQLLRTSLIVYGSSTPLPISADFTEPLAELGPALERAAKVRTNADDFVRMRVEREVNYGQLTRVLQAGIGHRIFRWEIVSSDANGSIRVIKTLAPGGFPRGNCFATAWIGPDQRVQVGIDTEPVDAAAGMKGIIVSARDGRMALDNVLKVLHRLDTQCKEGQVRLLTQPTATFGPVMDLALAIEDAKDKPKVSQLQLVVPSLGPLDSPVEVVK